MNDLHDFDIRRASRRWSIDAAMRAYRAMNENPGAPGRMEFVDGRFSHSDAQRITMLGWMLEMVGADVAVRLGDPEVWRAAVESLDNDG